MQKQVTHKGCVAMFYGKGSRGFWLFLRLLSSNMSAWNRKLVFIPNPYPCWNAPRNKSNSIINLKSNTNQDWRREQTKLNSCLYFACSCSVIWALQRIFNLEFGPNSNAHMHQSGSKNHVKTTQHHVIAEMNSICKLLYSPFAFPDMLQL